MSRPRVAPWRALAACAWVAVVARAAYVFLPLLDGYFLADDFVPLVLFEQWRGEGRLGAMLAQAFYKGLEAGANHFYRPLSFLAIALQDAVSGVAARGWMGTAVGLHIANAALVAAIALLSAQDRPDARCWAAAAVGTALFLFFAPAVEVAAWISARADAMATFFSLVAVLAFVRSRRARDPAWWISLAAMVAACLSKESAAVVPFAILFYARFMRLAESRGVAAWIAALRMAAPWLALAIAYLVARWAMFGSATAVYHNAKPLGALLSAAALQQLAEALLAYARAQFEPDSRLVLLAVLTLLQVAAILLAPPQARRARGALLAAFGAALMAFLLLLPGAYFPPTGLGGRLLYQCMAFYAIFSAVALRHARWSWAVGAVTLVLVVLHASMQAQVARRWEPAYEQMRALVSDIRRVDAALGPAEFALLLVPQVMGRVPFGANAQAGLMMPPLFPPTTSHRLLVQIYDEVPELAGKIRDGVIPTMREHGVFGYLEGKRAAPGQPLYPTQVLCWDAARGSLVPLAQGAPSSPGAWQDSVKSALAASPCARVRS